jgi:hypothetical protein
VAKVTGTGLGVWEVIDLYKGLKGNGKKLRHRRRASQSRIRS